MIKSLISYQNKGRKYLGKYINHYPEAPTLELRFHKQSPTIAPSIDDLHWPDCHETNDPEIK